MLCVCVVCGCVVYVVSCVCLCVFVCVVYVCCVRALWCVCCVYVMFPVTCHSRRILLIHNRIPKEYMNERSLTIHTFILS